MTVVIETWLNLPVPGVLLVLLLLFGAAVLLLQWLAFASPTRAWSTSFGGVVAPFFNATAILFALQVGFLGSEIADRNRQAARAVAAEANALRAAHTLSLAAAADTEDVRAAIHDYLQSVLTAEWPSMVANGPSPRTDSAFAALLREASDPGIAVQAGPAVQQRLLAELAEVGRARADRLGLSSDYTAPAKWMSVLLLGLITLGAVALVHLDRRRAMVAALTFFSAAAVVAVGLIAIQEQPFAGPLQVQPTPLVNLLHALTAPAS